MTNIKRGNQRILIVDDSIINQEIVIDFIEHLGFTLDTADDGLQGLVAVKLNSYSLIFMDIQMPVMDGLAATKAIREYETSLGLKPAIIIALTAESSAGIKQRCLDAGMNDYLEKPFSQQDLLQKITHWLPENLSENSQTGTKKPASFSGDNATPLLDAVEDIAQVSHWFWHFSDQRIEFSKYLQHHFDFPLRHIKTLDDYINKVGSEEMKSIVSECISNRHETRWEQKITEPGMEQPKHLLHRYRFVICEDNKPVLIGTIQDISSIRQAEQQLIELTSFDPVTGFSSRFRFNQQLEDLIQYSSRHSQKFALLYFSFDATDEIKNHQQTGEKLLVEITKRLQKILRRSDFACRIIDDEFCLVIKDVCDEVIVTRIAERYRQLFEQPITLAANKITAHASIGLALYPQDGVTPAELTSAAHTAMNKIKNTGGNQFAFFDSSMTEAARHRQLKENELRLALGEDQFQLYYQPKVSLQNGKMVSVEAMIRWHHPDKTLQLPDSFLAEAEDLGLTRDIEHWVLQQACKQINAWREQGHGDIPIAVNISQQHFTQPEFTHGILQIVNDASVPASLIEIETTESLTAEDKAFSDTCKQLHSLGFRIAIDGFSSGYSSLSSLKEMPIDVLKIDRKFIRDLLNDKQSSIIIGTILGISNALGLQVVAEGVENNQQLKALAAMGCHMAQGFYFSEPVPAAEIPALNKHNFRNPNLHRVA